MDKIDEILTRIVANIIPSRKKLETLLRSGKKLNVYFGAIQPVGLNYIATSYFFLHNGR